MILLIITEYHRFGINKIWMWKNKKNVDYTLVFMSESG